MEGICESHFSREYNTDVINHCCSRCGEFIYQEVVGNRWPGERREAEEEHEKVCSKKKEGYIKAIKTLNKMAGLDIEYKEFLKSEEWKKIRFNVFLRDDFKCVDCGEDCCEAHHESYEDIYDETNIISLCHNCHSKRHDIPIKNNKKIKGWANSINITKMAQRENLIKCVCGKKFKFVDIHGFFYCSECNIAGDINDFAGLVLLKRNKTPIKNATTTNSTTKLQREEHTQ